MKIWCVKHKGGWCACKKNVMPTEEANSTPTLCNYFIILGMGVEQRDPTCEECLEILLKNEVNVN